MIDPIKGCPSCQSAGCGSACLCSCHSRQDLEGRDEPVTDEDDSSF